eukprot:c20856_g1_i3.p1 GENE.c20856_g1_i3~~c20856_g1_i3.p1  ORF type:complete len:862 (+),score=268.06 c20856_g1_i3:20-2605(+)
MSTTSNATKSRFDHFLLEDGEYLVESYSGMLFLMDENMLPERLAGVIHVCTQSLIFDPDQWNFPVYKFMMRDIQSIKQWQGQISSRVYSLDDNLFSFETKAHTESRQNNESKPFNFVRKKEEIIAQLHGDLDSILSILTKFIGFYRNLQERQAIMRCNWILDDIYRERTYDTSKLEPNETILLTLPVKCVEPFLQSDGLLVVTNSHLRFQEFAPLCFNSCPQIPLKDIIRILTRRYSLRQIGLEIFVNTNKSYFYTFKNPRQRDEMYNFLTQHEVCRKHLEPNDPHNMTLKWQNSLISNFDYLMYLNSIADRTFHDFTQYPVFPWVLADYVSETIDLNDEKIYRDLSKPIGAINPDRLEFFINRYNDMETSPKFHYGTHYSTPAFVLHWLVRLMPDAILKLQNGRFDVPDRLFHSIKTAWENVNVNTADVKELIPEFYTLETSDFLLNLKKLDLGVRHDNQRVDNVILPNWAKDSKHFISTLKNALESDYVSRNLHNWIDLIFGYKQRGKAAEDAHNIFFYLTYEGAVNEKELDPHSKHAIIQQIKYFGQTPSQLLLDPHPRRKNIFVPHCLFNMIDSHNSPTISNDVKVFPIQRFLQTPTPIVRAFVSTRYAIFVTATGAFAVFQWANPIEESNSSDPSKQMKNTLPFNFQLSFVDDKTIVNDPIQMSISELGSKSIFNKKLKQTSREVVCAISTNGKWIIFGRRWDNSMIVVHSLTGKVVQVLKGHQGVVECLDVATPKGHVLVSGGRDCCVAVWGFPIEGSKGFIGVHSEREEESLLDSDKKLPLSIAPLRYLHGHTSCVVAVVADSDLDCVISAGADGSVLVHTLSKGKFMRKIEFPISPPLPPKNTKKIHQINHQI